MFRVVLLRGKLEALTYDHATRLDAVMCAATLEWLHCAKPYVEEEKDGIVTFTVNANEYYVSLLRSKL